MQKDFHYYGVFYLSLCAGIEPATAYKIAYSSQYVDDSTESKKISLIEKKGRELGFVDPVRTAHNGLESFWKEVWEKIYYPFHFVPGNKGKEHEGRYITVRGEDNDVAKEYLDKALKTEDSCRIGIALHAYADTFSHQNFSGRWSEVNSVDKMLVYYSNLRRKKIKIDLKLWLLAKLLKEATPAIGHAEAYMVPDHAYYHWVYFNNRNEYVPAANEERFLSFAESVYNDFLCKASSKIRKGDPEQFDSIRSKILLGINREGSLKKRCKYWKKLIKEKLGSRKLLEYDKYKWRKEALGRKVKWDKRKRLDQREIFLIPKKQFLESNWLNFHRAALGHRIEALGILTKKNLVSKKTYNQVVKREIVVLDGKKLNPILSG